MGQVPVHTDVRCGKSDFQPRSHTYTPNGSMNADSTGVHDRDGVKLGAPTTTTPSKWVQQAAIIDQESSPHSAVPGGEAMQDRDLADLVDDALTRVSTARQNAPWRLAGKRLPNMLDTRRLTLPEWRSGHI